MLFELVSLLSHIEGMETKMDDSGNDNYRL
jgi:hypothetical protein